MFQVSDSSKGGDAYSGATTGGLNFGESDFFKKSSTANLLIFEGVGLLLFIALKRK